MGIMKFAFATMMMAPIFTTEGLCIDEDAIITRDTELVGFTYQTVEKVSLLGCVNECLIRSQCQSFHYQKATELCELNSATFGPTREASGKDFSVISSWPTVSSFIFPNVLCIYAFIVLFMFLCVCLFWFCVFNYKQVPMSFSLT